MIHFAHMMVFSGLLSCFFAFLQAPRGRRVRYVATLWSILAGVGLGLSLMMYPVS